MVKFCFRYTLCAEIHFHSAACMRFFVEYPKLEFCTPFFVYSYSRVDFFYFRYYLAYQARQLTGQNDPIAYPAGFFHHPAFTNVYVIGTVLAVGGPSGSNSSMVDNCMHYCIEVIPYF